MKHTFIDKKAELNVVFIHGNSLSSKTFKNQFNLNYKANLYFLDLPGHGESAVPNSPMDTYSMTGLAQEIVNFIEEQNLQNIVLVGHSLGGHLALQSLYFKDDYKGIFIFGAPPLNFPPDMAAAFKPVPESGLAYKKDLSKKEAQVLASLFVDEKYQTSYTEMILQTDPNFRACFLKNAELGNMNDEVKILSKITFPICICVGEQDKLINVSYIKNLHIPTLAFGEVNELSGGHSPQMDEPDQFNKKLIFYLESINE